MIPPAMNCENMLPSAKSDELSTAVVWPTWRVTIATGMCAASLRLAVKRGLIPAPIKTMGKLAWDPEGVRQFVSRYGEFLDLRTLSAPENLRARPKRGRPPKAPEARKELPQRHYRPAW
ncbi:hypothetical protein CHELA20_52665 [Hyphomicrobiales bacterium]|nr:hypothetical protein CHELA41_22262 [Hyphomicrobiales bacterium]CAH1682553.1 hypothetical protein CHELA20_52665 [Hyphomicrobiales bacterium]